MYKLSEEIFESCTIENCASNELVALPKEGDVGFREYFNLKAGMVYERKSLFSPRECNELILRYPGLEAGDRMFSLFFESPNVVARNNAFEGCFAIDITEYLHHTDSEAFRSLMSYVIDHEETVFLFFLLSDKPEDCERMFNAITAYTDVEYRRIPLPEAKVLVHPECPKPVRIMADKVGSTQALLNYAVDNESQEFIVCTESGILFEMQRRCPEKTFIPAPPEDGTCACNECEYMKLITLEKLYNSLKYMAPEVEVDSDIAERAVRPIQRMLDISRDLGIIK